MLVGAEGSICQVCVAVADFWEESLVSLVVLFWGKELLVSLLVLL